MQQQTIMRFHPSQQKCSLDQAAPKHASIILHVDVHNIFAKADN